jgi:hypothetical protein
MKNFSTFSNFALNFQQKQVNHMYISNNGKESTKNDMIFRKI